MCLIAKLLRAVKETQISSITAVVAKYKINRQNVQQWIKNSDKLKENSKNGSGGKQK